MGLGLGDLFFRSFSSPLFCDLDFDRDLRRLSWRLRLGLGDPEEEEDEEEEREEEPERLEPEEELEPLEEPELEPELLLDDELERDLLLLLPVDALRRLRVLSRPRSFSAPSLAPDLSLPRSFVLSSERSFRFVGEGAIFGTGLQIIPSHCQIGRAHV